MGKSKELKIQEAKERQENKRKPQDQLIALDYKFGKNIGAKKERNKLLSIINKKNETKEVAVVDEEGNKVKKKKKKDE